MTNPCWFCGGTDRKITKEHVWPQWLADFLPGKGTVNHAERWSSDVGRQRFPQPFLSATVRKFCDGCNNGWMGGVEGTAKDIVGPMAQGIPTTLDAAAQRAVANWVAVKGLVAALTSQDEQPIPDYHYRRVWAAQGAPAHTMLVWVGQRRNLAHPVRPGQALLFDSHFMPVTDVFPQFPVPPDLERYRSEGGVFNGTIFQVGHFFALALQHDWPGLRGRAKPDSEAADAFLPVWPTGPAVRWPPRRPVDDLGDAHKVTRFIQMAPPLAPVEGP